MIGSYIVCGGGEAERYLPAVLDRTLPLVDWMVVCLVRGTDKERELFRQKGIEWVEDDREWGKKQWIIKEEFFRKHIAPKNADWLVCLDADEILDERITRETLVEMQGRGEIAFDFYFVQLWDREDQMRVDGGWGNFTNVRYFRYLADAPHNWKPSSLHCGLAPEYAYNWRTNCEYYIKHYGYLKSEEREKKIERYRKYDPYGLLLSRDFYYRMEHPERGEFVEFRPERLAGKLKYDRKRPNIEKVIKKFKPMEKTVYIQNRHGKIFPMKESLAKEAVKRGSTILYAQDDNLADELLAIKASDEVEVVEEKETPQESENEFVVTSTGAGGGTGKGAEEAFSCNLCEKVFPKKQGLSAHKRFGHAKASEN